MRLVFALLITLLVTLAAYADKPRIVRLATSTADSVQIDADTTWWSSARKVDTSKPVQLVVLLGTVTGNITIGLAGYCVSESGSDSWPLGAESLVTVLQRASITSGGRYMLQVTPSVAINSTTLGGLLRILRPFVATDSATDTNFDAWLVYYAQ